MRISGEYLTEEERKRKEDIQSKELFISKQQKFISCYRATNHYIENYVGRDPSQNPLLHKFREETKSKFVGGAFKP